MKKETKLIFKILTRHLFIGVLVTVFIFWVMGEFPDISIVKDRFLIWLTLPFILALSTWTVSTRIYKQLTEKNNNEYLVSLIFIFFSWTILFLATATLDGLESSIKHNRLEIFDALEGYTIYRLWVYLGLGIIHGLIGGPFLALNLKKVKSRSK